MSGACAVNHCQIRDSDALKLISIPSSMFVVLHLTSHNATAVSKSKQQACFNSCCPMHCMAVGTILGSLPVKASEVSRRGCRSPGGVFFPSSALRMGRGRPFEPEQTQPAGDM